MTDFERHAEYNQDLTDELARLRKDYNLLEDPPATTGEKVRIMLGFLAAILVAGGFVWFGVWEDGHHEAVKKDRFYNVCEKLGGSGLPGKDDDYVCIRDKKIVYTATID